MKGLKKLLKWKKSEFFRYARFDQKACFPYCSSYTIFQSEKTRKSNTILLQYFMYIYFMSVYLYRNNKTQNYSSKITTFPQSLFTRTNKQKNTE